MNKKIYYFLTFSFAFLFMFLSGCADSKETLSNTLEISATSSEENSFSQNDESVSILDNQAEGVIISGITSGNEYDFNSKISIVATNASNKYLIWHFNDVQVYFGDSYSFNMPANTLIIKLKNCVKS